jgi:hypothetical protein
VEPFDLFCCCFDWFELVAVIANFMAWDCSAPNREARHTARRNCARPPTMSGWTKAFYILTPIVVFLAFLLILRWFVRR